MSDPNQPGTGPGEQPYQSPYQAPYQPPYEAPYQSPYQPPPPTAPPPPQPFGTMPPPAQQYPVPPGYPQGAPYGYPAAQPPPQYGGYPSPTPYPRYGDADVVGSPSRLRTTRIWAVLAQITIFVDVIAHAVFIRDVAHEHALVQRIISDPESVTLDQAKAADDAAKHAGVLLIVLLVLGGVFLIVWLYRVRADAEAFDPHRTGLGRGWAIGSWFVPIGNLVLPFLVVRDVIRATRTYPDGSVRGPWLMPLAAVWWGLWVVGGVGSRFVHLDTNGTLGQLDRTLHEVVLLIAIEGVAGVLAVAVIEVITRANRQRWAAQPSAYGGWGGAR